MRDIISQIAISKSICGNLKRRLKKRGIRSSFLREEGVLPKLEGPLVGLGSEMCGFMTAEARRRDRDGAQMFCDGSVSKLGCGSCAHGAAVLEEKERRPGLVTRSAVEDCRWLFHPGSMARESKVHRCPVNVGALIADIARLWRGGSTSHTPTPRPRRKRRYSHQRLSTLSRLDWRPKQRLNSTCKVASLHARDRAGKEGIRTRSLLAVHSFVSRAILRTRQRLPKVS